MSESLISFISLPHGYEGALFIGTAGSTDITWTAFREWTMHQFMSSNSLSVTYNASDDTAVNKNLNTMLHCQEIDKCKPSPI